MRRTLAWAAVAVSALLLAAPTAKPAPAQAAASSAFSFNWTGGATAPVLWSGQGFSSSWDVQIHKRSVGDTMDAMDAQHGADCAPPPASHPINTLAQGVFICRNHVMTAINAGDYGEIALTSDHMVDFSSGTASIQVSVSTQQFCTLDWIEVWVTPFAENITLPHGGTTDLQGPPRDALRFSLDESGDVGTHAGQVSRFANFTPTLIGRQLTMGLDALVPPSAVTRTTYEIDLSTSHVRFGLPGVGAGGTWWTNTDISPLSYNQGIVQLVHHSYNVNKHCPGVQVDTWHWSGFSLSNSVPFTILPSVERSIHAGGPTTAHFPAPAPANAYLRFSGIGTISVSFDAGRTWQPAQQQSQRDAKSDHFATYWTPIPAGAQQVTFSGLGWYGGPWWVRDAGIWSDGKVAGPIQTGGGTPTSNPTSNPTNNPTSNPTSKPTSQPSSGGSGETGGSSSGGDNDKSPTGEVQKIVADLDAAVNPHHDPIINLVLLALLAGALVAIFRMIRGT